MEIWLSGQISNGSMANQYATNQFDLALSTTPKPSKFVDNCSADSYFKDTTSRSGFTTRLQMVGTIQTVLAAVQGTFILVSYADGGTEMWVRNGTSAIAEPYPNSMTYGSGIAAPCRA
ncbi:MAG: hypothetical protein WCB36_11000 [Burkholderiales bacterium]